jgi:hypothetical protein
LRVERALLEGEPPDAAVRAKVMEALEFWREVPDLRDLNEPTRLPRMSDAEREQCRLFRVEMEGIRAAVER